MNEVGNAAHNIHTRRRTNKDLEERHYCPHHDCRRQGPNNQIYVRSIRPEVTRRMKSCSDYPEIYLEVLANAFRLKSELNSPHNKNHFCWPIAVLFKVQGMTLKWIALVPDLRDWAETLLSTRTGVKERRKVQLSLHR